MASQAEKDTAAAKAKQGGGQTAIDTAAAKAKQNNNNQAAKDTARAKSRQNGGDGGTSARMSQREAAAGLYLAGNDTISAGRGGSGPSFAQREAAAGLTNTMSGRVASRAANPDLTPVGTPLGNDEFVATQNVAGGGGGDGELYAFKVVDEGNGTVSVETGTVNTETATGLTPSGKPSTTHDYSQRRIPAIISREGITMNRLIKDISMVVSKYDSYGSESDYGNRSNRAYINALKRFEEYIQSENYLQ